jgi:uncharacterized protein (DUF1499 family)
MSWLSVTLPIVGRHLASISVLVVLLAGLAVLGGGCSPSGSLPPAGPSNPLPSCPDSPNCERLSRAYAVPADSLFAGTRRALAALGPSQMQLSPDSLRGTAAYRVAGVFTDDVQVAVTTRADSSVLHARSASRVGHSDLGVNRRRMLRLLDAVRAEVRPSGR